MEDPFGLNLFEETNNSERFINAFMWLYKYVDKDWEYKQINEFDTSRRMVLFHMAIKQSKYLESFVDIKKLTKLEELKDCMNVHDGIPLFWKCTL